MSVSAEVRCSKHLSESFQRAVGVLAKRWTPLILFVLRERPRRFNEIADQIEFVSDRMLSERLKELEAEGLIERRIYAEVPVRVEYRLTEKGHDLGPVFMALCSWASRWLEAGATPGSPRS
jgi:DNA-binding HxlR family transcriptional regulator